MSQTLVIIGIVLIIIAFLIGVKKQTWILSGFNEKRVEDKDKLAKIVGLYSLVIGSILLIGGFIDYPNSETPLISIMAIGYIILLGYVNTKMIE